MTDKPIEGSSAWYTAHAERLAGQAVKESNPGRREELKRAARGLRTRALEAATAEKKRADRALALKIR